MSVERGIWVGRSGGVQWKQEGNQSQRHEVESKGLVEPHSEAWQGLGRHFPLPFWWPGEAGEELVMSSDSKLVCL